MSYLQVIKAGLYSSIQDLGRVGVAHLGLSQGGAMDVHAHCWANKLLSNTANDATLEISFGQAEFKAVGDIRLSLTGADMQACIDGLPQKNWQSFYSTTRTNIISKDSKSGIRAYLALQKAYKHLNYMVVALP